MTGENQPKKTLRAKRLPQLTRVGPEELPGFRLTARDVAICQAVHACHALTSKQI